MKESELIIEKNENLLWVKTAFSTTKYIIDITSY